MKNASNNDIKNIVNVYTNNSEDVALEMANVDIHANMNLVSYLNHNANVFTPEVREFKMINEPIISTMNFDYYVPITLINCNVLKFIPQYSDVCILINRSNLFVPHASFCDGTVNTLEEVINLSYVKCSCHTCYKLYPNLIPSCKHAIKEYMSSPLHDLHINDFISSIYENEAPVNPITLTLNIHAELFTPSNEINMNCRMGAIMVTILSLSTFIVYELNINNEQVVNDTDPKIILKNLKNANPNKIIIGHLNINSIRKKL